MNRFLMGLAAMGVLLVARGCKNEIPRPDVPDILKAPASEEVILVGHATGIQIYTCQAGANPPWVFKAPEADLKDSAGRNIIHHFAGPTWRHNDGSEVVAKVTARQDSPRPGAIPWLLLTATGHTGQGVLSPVTSIQRIHTEGGVAPDANTCDAAANGKESRSPYAADYYFYAPRR